MYVKVGFRYRASLDNLIQPTSGEAERRNDKINFGDLFLPASLI